MYEVLIPALTFVGAVAIGGAIVLARSARAEPIEARLRGLAPVATVAGLPRRSWLEDSLRRLGRAVASGGTSQTLREQLTRAGYHGEGAPLIYMGAKILLAAGGLVGVALFLLAGESVGPVNVSAGLLVTAMLFFLPNLVVAARRRQRRAETRAALPDAVDLLEVCVSAGMGLDMAWNVVSEEIRRVSPILADEMALTNLEIHLGAPRIEAMRHLAERTGVEEIGSLVAVLVQSERFGTSIADALQVFATSMRENRSTIAQEAAERMAVRLIFPMVIFIFPTILVVTVGPAAISLLDALRR